MFKMERLEEPRTYYKKYVDKGRWIGEDNKGRPIISAEVKEGNLYYSVLDHGAWQSAFISGCSESLPIDVQQYVYHFVQVEKNNMRRQKPAYTPLGRIFQKNNLRFI